MTTRYAAKFAYGKPCILKLEVSEETEKIIVIDSEELASGKMHYGIYASAKPMKKNAKYVRDWKFFDTIEEATKHMIEQADEHAVNCEESFAEAKATLRELLSGYHNRTSE